jgi:serine/threonine protein phosphatase PrpC
MTRIGAYGLSDVGLTRSHNEDCYRVDDQRGLFVVADGMGGHRHGEVAARVAVDAIGDFIEEVGADEEMTLPFPYDERYMRHTNILKTAVRLAHRKVLLAIREDLSLVGMGATVVAMYLHRGTAAVAHVGDSRAYRLREGQLDLLTQDHTWVNEQVVAGHLSREQARTHPFKNVVTRALGGESDVMVDVREEKILPADSYLLCSDGLTTMLSDEEILAQLNKGKALQGTCESLIVSANDLGGVDNVTVVLLSVEEEP